jgi:hypothetical protein
MDDDGLEDRQRPYVGLVPAHFAFGPSLDQVVRNSDGCRNTQLRMLAFERREDFVAAEPPDIHHLAIVLVDLSGQRFGVTADHQR